MLRAKCCIRKTYRWGQAPAIGPSDIWAGRAPEGIRVSYGLEGEDGTNAIVFVRKNLTKIVPPETMRIPRPRSVNNHIDDTASGILGTRPVLE